MATFEEQLEKSKRIDADTISDQLFAFIKSLSKELIQLNKDQININSEDIYGKAIGFYSKATEFITDGEKRAGQPFTGKDTGDWLDAFYMTVYDGIFYFGSTDPKTDDILDSPNWLSKDLFGLTEDNLYVFTHEKIKPFIINYYRKSLDL
jgi:hypothetical protein